MITEYVGQHTVADMDRADGNVYFEKEYMEFRPRSYEQRNLGVKIFYKAITDVKGYKSLKSTVAVETTSGVFKFYMYKMNTFIELVNAGRKGWNVVDAEVKEVKKEPLTDAQLDKLAKLNELHKQGVLTDEQFEEEKNLILNR